MDLIAAIDEALRHLRTSIPNEAATCEWVILPLLHAAGYERKDVLAKNMDSGGTFPDYTLLPKDEEYKLYLEAKASQISLEAKHANQALNYANNNGKRWVILTNGWEWRLYDNAVMGKADAKLAAQTELTKGPEAQAFLRAIGKESVCSDGLPKFAAGELEKRKQLAERQLAQEAGSVRRELVRSILEKEFPQADSVLVQALLEHLRHRPGLSAITAEDICDRPQETGGDFIAPLKHRPEAVAPPPGATEEVLVVPAGNAWREYQKCSAYICQDKRAFQPTSHIAFYCDGAIETLVPRILKSTESVLLSPEGIRTDISLSATDKVTFLQLVSDLETVPGQTHVGKRQKVLFLSSQTSGETIRLPHRILNDKKDKNGNPWAFAVGQRYIATAKLLKFPLKTSALE